MEESKIKKEMTENEINSKIQEKIVNNQEFRKQLCKERFRWFAYTYFSHYIKSPSAPFHEEIYNTLEDWEQKFVEIIAFRESSKSTIATLEFAIWSIISGNAHFLILGGDTHAQSKLYIYNLKNELDNNKLLIKDWGPFEESDEWTATGIVLPRYEARILSRSTGQKVRGLRHKEYRPDLFIGDDLENIESVRNQEGRDKTYRWLFAEVIPALDDKAKKVLIGNLLHSDCLLMKIKKQIESGERDGRCFEIPLLNDKKEIAWPGRYPDMDAIEKKKREVVGGDPMGNRIWLREYLLKIVPEEGQIIKDEWIQSYDELPKDENGIEADVADQATAIDLAISKKETADYTSMVSGKLYYVDGKPKLYIMPHPVNERLSFKETIERAKSVSLTLGNGELSQLYVEEVAYQKAAIETMVDAGLPVLGVRAITDKRARLQTVASYVENGIVVFPKKGCEDLIIQLTGLGIETHDDLADAFAHLVRKVLSNIVSDSSITIF